MKSRPTKESPVSPAIVLDASNALRFVDDRPDLIKEIRRWRSRDNHSKELCHVPLIDHEAMEMQAREVDASQYGINGPQTRREVEAFRIIRSERAICQAEDDRHREQKRNRTGDGARTSNG